MSKKILIIEGSARKQNTHNVLLQMEEILKKHGFECEFINLFDCQIEDCVGCEMCITNASCFIEDDMQEIMRRIMASDGTIFASPVYMCGVTSRLKTFCDRTNRWIHKPEAAGKPVMFVSTTAATGLKEVGQYFSSYSNAIGARKGDYITRAGKDMAKPVREKEMKCFINLLNSDKKRYRPAMKEIIMFNVGKVMALKSEGDDNKFWQERRWFDMNYYYPCKINFGKKLFGKFMFKILSKVM